MKTEELKITIKNLRIPNLFRSPDRKLCLSVIFIFYLLFFILNPKAYADFSLGIYPPILQIEAKPPANVSTPLLLENLSSEPLELSIEFKPFTASDQENGQIRFLKGSEISDDYLLILRRIGLIDKGINIQTLSLGPKQKKELNLTLSIPRDLPAGRQGISSRDYYFSVVFLSKGQGITERTATQTLGGLATNVLLSVRGETIQASGVIQEFSSPIFVEKGPVPFTVRVKNTGEHFIAPKGEIIIRNLLGEEVGKVSLLPVNILTKSVRSIPAEGSDAQALWKENIIIGPYRAILNIVLSDNGPQFQREIIFFAFPAGSFIAILGGFILLLYLASRIRRKI